MATFTENYNLIKPDGEDYYDIADFNENMDTLDSTMAAMETAAAEVSEKIGTPAEAGQTLFSLLGNSSSSVLRSVQRVKIATPNETVALNHTVIPEKCFVISERLRNNSENLLNYDYTLYADRIEVDHHTDTKDTLKIGFWVVEFV